MTTSLESSCLVCHTPLTGALGSIGRVAGIRRSNRNPNLCNRCDMHVEEGRIVETAVFFADLTRFTPLTRELGPERTHEVVDAFLRMAKEIVVKWDGFVLQFAGDEIMALFNVPLQRADFRRRAVGAAADLQQGMSQLRERFGLDLQTTVGVAAGHARVGRLGSEDLKDYTAIGDVVNRAARLVSNVEPGGILVDEEVHAEVREEFPDAVESHVNLKGYDEPVQVHSLVANRVLTKPAAEETPGRRPMRAAMLLAAIVGAPCAGFMVLNPAILALGLGAAGLGTTVAFLDQPAIRVPLLTVATLAALGNLLLAARARWQGAPGPAEAPGWAPSLGAGKGLALSLGALGVVFFELFAHRLMH